MLDGRTIGKYRILEQIGRGGMGTVYKAVDETLDRTVAIKMINADNLSAERMQRFRSEAVTLAKLSHPRIATIHELTRDEHDLLMVMEYVPGDTLERIVTRNGALPLPQAVMLCEQVLEALAHAHTAGIVHRDLKPSNLMVTPSGDVKVMDFGIARIAGSEHLTTDGYMMGTPAYMSPEQVRGAEVDARMDLYAIAVVLYRLLTNSLPFKAESPIQLIQSQLMDQPTAPRQVRPDLPPWVDDVLLHGLAKTPDQRFQTAAEFRLALQRGMSGAAIPLAPSLFDQTGAETYAAITPVGLRTSPSQAMPIPGTPSGALRMPSGQMPLGYTPGAMPSASMPVAPPTGSVPADATVTLRKPQLALMAGLLGLLVVVVGVLAYAALRRPSAPTTVATTDSTPGAPALSNAAPATPPPTTSSPADTAAPAAAPGTSAPNAGGAAASATTTPPVASSPAPSTATPATAAAAAARSGAASTTPAAPPAATKGRATPPVPAAVPAKDATAAATKAAAPPVPAPAPPTPSSEPAPTADAANTETESFGDLKAVLPQGGDNTKGRELDVLLGLEPGKLVIRSRGSGAVLKTLPYKSIAAATYVRDKRPKGSDDPSMAAVPENFGGSSGFLGSAKHWLTLQSNADFLILRLEDKNMRSITLAIESRTGVKTQRIGPNK